MITELTLCRTYEEAHHQAMLRGATTCGGVTYRWDARSRMLTLDTDPPSRIHYVVIDSDLLRRIVGMVYSKVNGDLPLDPALCEQVLLRVRP